MAEHSDSMCNNAFHHITFDLQRKQEEKIKDTTT